MIITIVIKKTQTGNGLECGWHHAQKRWAVNLEDFEKKIQLILTLVLRSWGPTMVLRSWDLTMQLKVDIGPWRQTVVFSAVAAAVKFFGSRPAKMNWDLKHHEMCRTLGVLLAYYDYERLLRNVSLSLRVEEPNSEVNKCVRTWKTEFACVFESVSICITAI